MHILISLAMALALLYFWLIGHWFARVLMFLALAATVFAVAASSINYGIYDGKAPIGVLLFEVPIGLLAWPLASLPVYFWRWRVRQMMPVIYR